MCVSLIPTHIVKTAHLWGLRHVFIILVSIVARQNFFYLLFANIHENYELQDKKKTTSAIELDFLWMFERAKNSYWKTFLNTQNVTWKIITLRPWWTLWEKVFGSFTMKLFYITSKDTSNKNYINLSLYGKVPHTRFWLSHHFEMHYETLKNCIFILCAKWISLNVYWSERDTVLKSFLRVYLLRRFEEKKKNCYCM